MEGSLDGGTLHSLPALSSRAMCKFYCMKHVLILPQEGTQA
jgi:hypothetical protein